MKQVSVIIRSQEGFAPSYASSLAAGADVKACIEEDIWIVPGGTGLIPTGVYAQIPPGYEIQVRPRSGLALKNMITVLNTPGTIDADYRGEIRVILINHGSEPFRVTKGMRIAQLVVAEVAQAEFLEVDHALSATDRGDGGFGHTGMM